MKLNTPLPQPLSKECLKAAKIFRSFLDSRNNGLDGVIPRTVLQNAKGFAIFTVFKAGFVFSARAGSGVVIAKLEDGTWSAPSAIGTAGLGFGGQAGAEVTDFLVVLNTRAAIRQFMSAGSLTLGGNLSIALGPLGRNGEAIGSVNTGGKVAAMYSYSKTKGLFGGISIEGSVIVERQDANAQAYSSPVTVKMLLGGMVDPPPWAEPLIKTLETCTKMPGVREWVHDTYNQSPQSEYAFAGPSRPQPASRTSSFLKRKEKTPFPPPHWGVNADGGSYFTNEPSTLDRDDSTTRNFDTSFEADFPSQAHNMSDGRSHRMTRSFTHTRGSLIEDLDNPFNNTPTTTTASPARTHFPRSRSLGGDNLRSSSSLGYESTFPVSQPQSATRLSYDDEDNDDLFLDSPVDVQRRPSHSRESYIRPKPELARPLMPGEGVARAVALYNFNAVEDGDLSFNKGDVIVITKKSNSTDDWWTGRVHDKEGIFPANFVEVV